jgi:hypothetical protein
MFLSRLVAWSRSSQNPDIVMAAKAGIYLHFGSPGINQDSGGAGMTEKALRFFARILGTTH